MYIEVWRSTANNQWYFHLVGANHKIIAQSEGYTSRAGAMNAISVIIGDRNVPTYDR